MMTQAQIKTNLIDKYMNAYTTHQPHEDKKYLSWLRGQIANVVELAGGGLLEIKKPTIKTNFCFGYGYNGVSTLEEYNKADDTMTAAKSNASYFMRKNLAQLTQTVDSIKTYLNSEKPDYCGSVPPVPYICDHYGDGITKSLQFLYYGRYECMSESAKALYRKATADELQAILNAYEIEIKVFEKRLQTYLKRYGLTKLHTWTYLSD